MSTPRPVWRRLALAASATLMVACGYRSVARLSLPDAEAIYLAPVKVATISEPELGELLRRELARELARRGVRLVPHAASGAATLWLRVLALTEDRRVAVGGTEVVAVPQTLRLELRLAATDDRTLWRSDLVEVSERRAVPRALRAAEEARRVALTRLARRAAVEVMARLEDER